jgi:hypothetical protein
MTDQYATPEQIQIIKRLHYETGNIRAAYRPYVRMSYVNALREIDMLNKKLASMNKKNKSVDPLARYSKTQLRELAILGERYMRDHVSADTDEPMDNFVMTKKKTKTVLRKKLPKDQH